MISHSRTFDDAGNLVPSPGQLIAPLFGDAVFETMRVQGGTAPLWNEHRQRLIQGLSVLDIHFPEDQLNQCLQRFCACLDAAEYYRVRLQVMRGNVEQYQGYSCTASPLLNIVASPLELTSALEIDLMLCETRLADNPQLAGIKHASRLEQVLCKKEQERARQSWSALIAEGIVCDQHDNLVEAVAANIFARTGQGWCTPPIETCGVVGVARKVLLERVFPSCNIPCREAHIRRQDLDNIEELFVCNAVSGVRLARQVWLAKDEAKTFSISQEAQEIQRRMMLCFGVQA